MLAEGLVRRAQRVEPLEHPVARFGGDAGAVVGDRDLHPPAAARQLHLDRRARARERDGIVEQVVQHAFELGSVARDHLVLAVGPAHEHAAVGVDAALVALADETVDQPPHVDRLEGGAAQLGIDAAGVGDLGDEEVDPAHVVGGDADQLPAQVGIGHPVEAFEGAAQRCQRVLQFVGDIGGKAFHRVDALAQGCGHVGDGAGEQADLVAAGGERGDGDLAVTPQPHPVRRAGEV